MNNRGRTFRINLLGPVTMYDPDGDRIALTSRKAMAMVGLLASAPGGERTRVWLRDKLWGSRAQPQAQTSLRRELANLRSLLGGTAPGSELIRANADRIWLDLDQVEVDVSQPRAERASMLPEREFLEGLDIPGEEGFEDWLREQRASYRNGLRATPDRIKPLDAVEPIANEDHEAESQRPSVNFLRPAVSVLAFVNSSGDAARGDFVAAFAEDVGVCLARFGTLRVLAEVGGISQIRYLVQGRVSISDLQVRIWIKLLERETGRQVWTERFDDELRDAFKLQDKFALDVARQIDSAIEKEEMRRALASAPDPADAYQLYWRANALFRRWNREWVVEATELCRQVQQLKPDHPWAYALAAFCRGVSIASGWTADVEAERAEAARECGLALQLGGEDASVLGYAAGTLLASGGDVEQARRLVERAGALGPGYQSLPFWRGLVACCAGESEAALEILTASLAINPRSAVRPLQQAAIGLCLFVLGRADEAIPVLEDARQRLPDHPVALAALAASQVAAGRTAEAVAVAEQLGRIDPQLQTVGLLRDREQREYWLGHLRIALAAAGSTPLRMVSSNGTGG